MPLDLSLKIDRVENISREEFQEKYMKAGKPCVIKHFYGKDAPIYNKWSFDYFKKELGQIEVGIYDVEGKEQPRDQSYKGAHDTMNFGDYIDLIRSQPTTKRLFLFNIFKHKKDLKNDFKFPDLADNVLSFMPFAFFGGKGGVTRIHHDMDMSNVFLTEVAGKKRVVLFDPKYSPLLYRYPFGVHTSVDINNPDYKRFPGLHHVKGYDFFIEAGDTVFMPSGWWHHIEYESGGIGMAMRSLSPYYSKRLRGLYNVGFLTHMDEILKKMLGKKWVTYKSNVADKRAAAALESIG